MVNQLLVFVPDNPTISNKHLRTKALVQKYGINKRKKTNKFSNVFEKCFRCNCKI